MQHTSGRENGLPMERVLYEVKKVIVGQDHLLERLVVGGVGLCDMRQLISPAIDQRLVLVDGKDLLAHADQRVGDRGAEPAEADDDHGGGGGVPELSQ